MSSNTKMLIDATHPEETRVVVQRNGRVEEFDFESAARKLLRGNIYLAKVTRVEPSLQAAFVDYGGNRHGFLAFNEIHPDYYQIPVADRQALIDEEAAAEAELEAAADRRAEALARRAQSRRPEQQSAFTGSTSRDIGDDASDDGDAGSDASHIIDVEEDEHIEAVGGDAEDNDAPPAFEQPAFEPQTFAAAVERSAEIISEDYAPRAAEQRELPERVVPAGDDTEPPHMHHEAEDDEDAEEAEQAGEFESNANDAEDHPDAHGDHTADAGEHRSSRSPDERSSADFHEEAPVRQRRRPRSYKIQEVIKRRQVILVQVVKEERGNKGAALTTYLSLAGRYTVLMPNTARGGGISRKITNPQDRKRLKAIANELEVPEGMGLIIRTAGAARTKQEIKRDFEYLLRLWESVRDLTLQSTAPSLVYEEGDLIKRSIRDLYNKDVEEVVVAGDAGYQEAAAFMHMLMPSHSKHVVPYNAPTPLFTSYGVERQLNAMFLPQVTLKSGGYIVINQTEALVAIDVNSGKSTREFSIEETALATNLEASDEIARQLKLRDLAGLIVIDFIDMEEKRNNRAVERRLKDALRFDRARIQLGRISHFGLMEMSRQRLRTGVLEGSTSQCPHCQGTGIIRSTESIALAVLRGLEDTITAGANTALIATTTPTVALYILNSKRAYVTDMEARHGYPVTIIGSDRIQGANFTVERGAPSALPLHRPQRAAVNMDWGFEGEGEDEAPAFQSAEIEHVGDVEDGDEGGAPERSGRSEGRAESRGEGDEDGNRKGGRRRRRRGRGRGQRGDEGERTQGARPVRGPDQASGSGDGDGDDAHDNNNIEDIGGDDAEGDIEDNGDSVDQTQRADRPDGARGEAGDRPGRRRRRGRRGGRRGREGNGSENGSRDLAARGEAPDDADTPDLPGLGEQPDLGAPSNDGLAPARDRSDDRPPRRNGHSDRARTDRIWDVPSATAEPRDHAGTAADLTPLSAPVTVTNPEPKAEDHRPAPRIATAGVSAPTAVETQPARPRHEAGSSEPRIERVVVRPDQSENPGDDAPAQPQRKGWWQRRFGNE
ncbi:MAG: Rne/Rng family ribonuclease [Hyphomicrobium sp.]|nr:Rne/Rng family ribonuclease [Hyphomicrobium sp.]